MKTFIARAALLSTFAFGALAGGGIAMDGGHLSVTGPQSAEARMQGPPRCGADLDTGLPMPCPKPKKESEC